MNCYKKPRGRLGKLLSSLNVLLKNNNHLHCKHLRSVSQKTQTERRRAIERELRYLHNQGFALVDVSNFKRKHMYAITKRWEDKNLSPGTIKTNFSYFEAFCRWLGKHDLIGDHSLYFMDSTILKREYATRVDKSEKAAGIHFNDILQRVIKLDEHYACQLALIAAFGLRAQEAWKLRPHLADGNFEGMLNVFWGTKGGRPRVLPIPMDEKQREVLEWAKSLAKHKSSSMIPERIKTVQQWRARYYYYSRKIGLCKDQSGITSHSLRHGKLNDIYEMLTNVPSPARGGDSTCVSHQEDIEARGVIAEYAGHNRVQISSAYLGPILTKK